MDGVQNQGAFFILIEGGHVKEAKQKTCAQCETTAVLVDGAFYRRRAYNLLGEKSPGDRASELVTYCRRHLSSYGDPEPGRLYRIFYYDCPPMEGNLYHPLLQRSINMKTTKTYSWSKEFLSCLASKRKVAIRLGELQDRESAYRIKRKVVNALCRGERTIESLEERDFEPDFVQKGVDMKIGLDIASLAHKGLVTRIVLIAGDSDFVPAAKHARREGIDFILDPMWQSIRPSLNEHIDGLHSCVARQPDPAAEKLHVLHGSEVMVGR